MGWMSDLEPKERRTLGACFGGWAMDSFDVNIYGLAIPSLLTHGAEVRLTTIFALTR